VSNQVLNKRRRRHAALSLREFRSHARVNCDPSLVAGLYLREGVSGFNPPPSEMLRMFRVDVTIILRIAVFLLASLAYYLYLQFLFFLPPLFAFIV